MKSKKLFRRTWMVLALALLGGSVFAQNPLHLYVNTGIGTIDHYDIGTVPYHVKGSAAPMGLGVNYAWKRCQVNVGGQMTNGNLNTISGTAMGFDVNAEFLYRCIDSESNRFHFYTGGALQGYGEIVTIPALQNASRGMTLFGNINDVNMVTYDFAFNKEKTHNWLTAYGKLTLPLFGMVNRPGYSYIHETFGMDGFEALFAGTETFPKFLPGCSTDLGLYLNLKNGNRIGLDYRWDYLSTGNKGTWRYDNAYHTVNVSFMFKLN